MNSGTATESRWRMSNARKHKTPAGSDTSVNRGTIFDVFGNSIRDVVPVANVTERALLVSALTAEGEGPSAGRPLVVLRADARGLHRVEYTTDGTTWVPASGVPDFPSKAAADSWALANGSMLSIGDRCVAAGVPYVWGTSGWGLSNDRALTWQIRKGGAQTGISSSSFVNVLSLSLPATAPAGRYRVDAVVATYSDSPATHYKSVRIGGTASISTGTPLDGAGDGVAWPANTDLQVSPFWYFDHSGGAIDVHMDVQISVGATRAAGAACRLAVAYIGPTT